jgi:hypothetical protein
LSKLILKLINKTHWTENLPVAQWDFELWQMTCRSNGHQNVPKLATIKFHDLDVTLRRKVRKCPEFTKHELKCKHMFLASRITGYPVQLRVSDVATQATVQFPPASCVPSDAVALEKTATVQHIQDEVATISRLSQALTAMDLGEIDRATLVNVETVATRIRIFLLLFLAVPCMLPS